MSPTFLLASLLPVLLPLPLPADGSARTSPSPAPGPREELAVVRVDGRDRRVTLLVPPATGGPPSLLVVLHGVGGNAERLRTFTAGAFDRLAAEENVLVAYPDACEGVWNDCRATGESPARRAGVDDVAFLEAVVDRARDAAGGELGGVFAAGYSNGGQMALRLALEAPGLVDGIALFGALVPVEEDRTCATDGVPVPTLLVAGTADPICPFAGGVVTPPEGPARGAVLSARASAAWLALRAGHVGSPAVVPRPDRDPGDGCRVVEYRWSRPGLAEVTLLEVVGGGHALPLVGASFPELVGPTAHDVDGAAEIWSFCSRQLPGGRASQQPEPGSAPGRTSSTRRGPAQ